MFSDPVKTFFDKTPGGALANAIKSELLDGIKKSPGVQFIKEHYPEIQNFIQKNVPITVDYDNCNLIVKTIFDTYSYRNPLCSPKIPELPSSVVFPVSPDNECALIKCKDERVFTTVIARYKGIIGQPGYFPKDTDAQTVCNFEYQRAVNDIKSLGYFPSFIKNIVISIGELSNGFQPQLRSLPVFRIATTLNGVTTIANDTFEDNGMGYFEGTVEYRTRCFYLEYEQPTEYAEDGIQYNGPYTHVKEQRGVWITSRFKVPKCDVAPDPPPPPEDKPPMSCCCPQEEQLLRLILKRIGTLPVNVPKSYLTKNGVQPTQTKQVESLTEFITWFAERYDETLGEFEITIEVDDADLIKEGKQKQTIRLPNLAESIAEIFSLMIHSNINNELILNIVNRTLIESGQIKQSEFKIHSALNALIDYIGFHTTSQSEKMPLSFTAGEQSFDKFLKESEQNVSVLTYDQKETLTATMQSLLQAAAITRAVHYRKTNGNQQNITKIVKKDLLKLLGDNGKITDQIKAFITNIEKVYDDVDNQPKQ